MSDNNIRIIYTIDNKNIKINSNIGFITYAVNRRKIRCVYYYFIILNSSEIFRTRNFFYFFFNKRKLLLLI